MGGCSSDFYTTVKKQHGELFQKYIVSSESLLEFKRYVKTKQETFDIKAQQKRQFIHFEIKKRQQVMVSHYEMTRKDISQKLPLGIDDYEQMKKQRLSQILGLQEYQRRFDSVHSQVDRQINDRKQITQKQYEQIVRQVEDQYKIDSQKMQLYHDMGEQRRAMIRQRGVKEFSQHITKRLSDLQNKYNDQLNTQKQIKSLQQVVSIQQLDHLVNMSKNKFCTQAINVMGGFMDSEIKV